MNVHEAVNDAANAIHAAHVWLDANAVKALFGAWAASVCGGLGYFELKNRGPSRPTKHSKAFLEAKSRADAAMSDLGLD